MTHKKSAHLLISILWKMAQTMDQELTQPLSTKRINVQQCLDRKIYLVVDYLIRDDELDATELIFQFS